MPENFESIPNWEGFIRMILQRLDIPSKEDIRKLHDRLDTLEQLLYQKKTVPIQPYKEAGPQKRSASAIILEVVANHPKGTNFKTIKAATGFDDKKIRNIIFRLDKIKKIKRVKRGIYKTL